MIKPTKNSEKELLEELKNADIFTVVNGWEVRYIDYGYKSVHIIIGLQGYLYLTLCISYNAKEDKLITNVPTFGSFDLCDGNGYMEYYKAVGSLLKYKNLLKDLKKTLKESLD